jgi:hypothetical protein
MGGAFPVILDAPFLDLDRCIVERNKDVLVEAFFPQARVETLDMRVLDWLARFNKLQPYTMVIGPLSEGLARGVPGNAEFAAGYAEAFIFRGFRPQGLRHLALHGAPPVSAANSAEAHGSPFRSRQAFSLGPSR